MENVTISVTLPATVPTPAIISITGLSPEISRLLTRVFAGAIQTAGPATFGNETRELLGDMPHYFTEEDCVSLREASASVVWHFISHPTNNPVSRSSYPRDDMGVTVGACACKK